MQTKLVPPRALLRPTLARVAGGLIVLLLSLLSHPAFTSPVHQGQGPSFKLGLVDNQPRPGRPSRSLVGRVAEIRLDYGRFTLARVTPSQIRTLREEGHRVRVISNPERVGIGYYSFKAPPGPVGLPLDLTLDESRGATKSRRGSFLIKMMGPARDEWLSELISRDVEILTPIPQFTYLVRAQARRVEALRSLPFVEWIGAYHPAFKLSQELARRAAEERLTSETSRLNVLVYNSGDVGGVVNQARALGGTLLDQTRFDFYERVSISVSEKKVLDLARNPDVYKIEPMPRPELEDESGAQIVAGAYSLGNIPFQPGSGQATYNDWLVARNLDGSNVTIGYADDGVLNSDPTSHLTGRVNEAVCGTAGSDGHGHFGAANAGGFCSHAVEPVTGWLYGVGVAPAVNFISLPFLKSTGACTANDSTRAQQTVNNNGPNGAAGTIQNNSWGSGSGDSSEDVSYTSFERAYDLLVRDADSGSSGNQELITCFSAGNSGDSTIGAVLGDSPATLTRPKAAKNIITTGCSGVYRLSAGGDNINDRCFFSSQGPTYDGRIKPDVMAPGGVEGNFAAIISARVNGFGFDVDGNHSLSAGTSFSSPHTAGGSALLVQWWDRFASAVPSPAVVKALLIHSAVDMQGGNTSALVPNRHEGWGRWNLGNILETGATTVVADGPIYKKTTGLDSIYLDQSIVFQNAGDAYTLRFTPDDPAQPVKATLVWTDAPGAVDSCPSLVNDLDLELIEDGATVLRGNGLSQGVTLPEGPIDVINNVELVVRNNPGDFFQLNVVASVLAGDGIPGNADSTDQDFALVLSNAVPYTGPIIASGTVATTDDCGGVGDSVIDPGELVTVSVPLTNSGAAAATSVTGTLTSVPAEVSIVDGTSAYSDISSGSTQGPNDTLSFLLAGATTCGGSVDMSLEVSTAEGTFSVPLQFDVGSRTVSVQNLSGATGVVEDLMASPTDFTTAAAASGTITDISVDLDLTMDSGGAFLFNHYKALLLSGQSTPVNLHNDPLPCLEVITNYPGDKLPISPGFSSLLGEDAAGIWTLRITDMNNTELVGGGPRRPASEATVNSWTVNITTESSAACNTCAAVAPPEVSPLGAATQFLLNHGATAGDIDFTWEDLGALADSYRLYQGNIADILTGGGVTVVNAAPNQCGVVNPALTLTPDPGDLFYLVAGQKGALVGPVGGTRTVNQTCP